MARPFVFGVVFPIPETNYPLDAILHFYPGVIYALYGNNKKYLKELICHCDMPIDLVNYCDDVGNGGLLRELYLDDVISVLTEELNNNKDINPKLIEDYLSSYDIRGVKPFHRNSKCIIDFYIRWWPEER